MKFKAVSEVMLTLLLLTTAIGVTASPWDGIPDDPTPAQAIWIDPKNITGLAVDDVFTVDTLINISDPPGAGTGLGGFEYKLKWDPTVLEDVEIQTHTDKVPSGDLLPGWTDIILARNETGSNYHWYAVAAIGGGAFTGVASLCTYAFRVMSYGSSALDIYYDVLVDDKATLIDHTTIDGYVTISDVCIIRADGSVSPPTAPISNIENVTYTLTGNINKPILVERDNIVVDGAGYTVQEDGSEKGIDLSGRNNVTIKNMEIKAFTQGVYLYGASNNTLSGNNITECSTFGIVLYSSSSNNTLSGNTITNNSVGIWFSESSNNFLSGNIMNSNVVANFGGVSGYELSHFMHSIDVSNLVEGKPIYYLVNQTNLVISSTTHPQVGYLALINCANVTVEGLTLTSNEEGLLLAYTNNSRITDSNITDNHHGVCLFMSFNNTLSGNTIRDNYADGFHLEMSSNNTVSGNTITKSWWGIHLSKSSNNSIHHNNFLNNAIQVYMEDSVNAWDDGYPSGGNYWDDNNLLDICSGPYQNETGRDGIGDTPYVIDSDNIDRYPLIYPYGWVPTIDLNNDGIINIVDIVTVALAFDSRPGEPKWNHVADFNQDGVINIIDIVMVAIHFDETW